MTARLSRETAIGVTVASVAVAAMAVDHLMGDDPGLEDPPAFLIAVGMVLAVAAVVFRIVVPRVKAGAGAAERAATPAMIVSVLAVLTLPFLFLGVPFVLGGGAVALGLLGRDGERRRVATTPVVVGAVVPLFGTAAYAGQAVSKLA